MTDDGGAWHDLADALIEVGRAAMRAGVDLWDLVRPYLRTGLERLIDLL